jgi:hypothetical protein
LPPYEFHDGPLVPDEQYWPPFELGEEELLPEDVFVLEVVVAPDVDEEQVVAGALPLLNMAVLVWICKP